MTPLVLLRGTDDSKASPERDTGTSSIRPEIRSTLMLLSLRSGRMASSMCQNNDSTHKLL